jgi:GTP pyrophosphokinase
MSDFKVILSKASEYLHGVDLAPLSNAYEFAKERHAGAKHSCGEPYIDHLLAVADILVSMKLDRDTIVSGILHGVLKEKAAGFAELEKKFGRVVANIVDGATRINKVHYNSHLADQAENIRKLFLAMGADIRVLLVRLADRLRDMRTMETAPDELKRHMGREVMDLYAPMASRLGIDWMKREMEDYSFSFLFPVEHADLTMCLESTLPERQGYVDEVLAILHKKLEEDNLYPLNIIGRHKHLYSIYKKLLAQKIPLERVYDKVAFRIIVSNVGECYHALGIVHEDWKPVPGRIKDFISSPKSNNYQSLHTTVIGPQGNFIEIQIRTDEMDRVAQEGVAAHWAYKEGQEINGDDARLFHDLKQLVKLLQEVEDPGEFMDSVRGELFEPDVYALTPDGEVRELPRGSTPIDFAYSIHTDVGDRCVGAKVNGHIVSLKAKLQNGDVVEILTAKNNCPKRAWLQIVKTSRARTRIRQWLRREEKERSLKLGREICEKELRKNNIAFKKIIRSGQIRVLLKNLGCNSLDDMLVKVGSGKITIGQLSKAFHSEDVRIEEVQKHRDEMLEKGRQAGESRNKTAVQEGIEVGGIDDMMVKISRCCKPVPGDAIMGFITTGAGISIHKDDCPNLLSTDPQRRLPVHWSAKKGRLHQVELFIRAEDRKNIIVDISSSISGVDAVITEFKARTTSENIAVFNVLVEVLDIEHIRNVQQRLRQIGAVIEVCRR